MTSSSTPSVSIPFVHLITANNIGIWECDLISDKLNFINDFFKILNLDSPDVPLTVMKQFRSFVHPEDLPHFDTSLSSIQNSVGATSTLKYNMVTPQGQTVWLESSFYSYQKNEQGKPQKIVSLTRNIQQEQEDMSKMLKENMDFKNLLKAIPDFVFVFDENFIFQDIILPEGLKLFHSREEIIGQHGSIVYSEEICQLFINNIHECIETGVIKEIEYPIDLFGSRYYYKARITPLEGRKAFILISDISDRIRRMENLLEARLQAEEADRMKTAFIANMTHEIRTPLNSIIGFTEIVAAEEDPFRKNEFLEIIRANNTLLLQLVNDILDLSLIESGKYEMNLAETNIYSLIDETESLYKTKMKPGIELNVIYPSENLTIVTDPNRVKQILFNFLSNAIKNTTHGTITLGVEEMENQLRFYVSDTGCGIPKDKFQTIFNRFEKLNSFTQGTGLGLSIAENLVRNFGGKIDVESEVGVGSTFSFTLPFSNIPAGMLKRASNKQSGDGLRKMLVVVESESKYNQIKEILEKKYQISWANNEDSAIQSFVLEKPDFVLTDIQVDGMDGINIIKRIRSMSTIIPIIGITSNNFYLEQRLAISSGCNEVIAYPFSASKLAEVILAYI